MHSNVLECRGIFRKGGWRKEGGGRARGSNPNE